MHIYARAPILFIDFALKSTLTWKGSICTVPICQIELFSKDFYLLFETYRAVCKLLAL